MKIFLKIFKDKYVFNINKKQIRNKCERFIIGEEFNILSKLYVLKLIQKILNCMKPKKVEKIYSFILIEF